MFPNIVKMQIHAIMSYLFLNISALFQCISDFAPTQNKHKQYYCHCKLNKVQFCKYHIKSGYFLCQKIFILSLYNIKLHELVQDPSFFN